MLVLAVDTSSARSLAGLVTVTAEGSDVLAERFADDGKAHSELLAGLIAAAYDAAGVGPSDLDAVVVGAGPGPFTGLRVGIVTASTIAALCDVPVYGVGSLDAIAVATPIRPLLVVTDARRREVYRARYDVGQDVADPQVGPPDEVVVDVAVTGAATALYPDVFGPPVGPDHPTAAALVQCATERLLAGAATDVVEPLYLRRPDAVVPTTGRKPTVQR